MKTYNQFTSRLNHFKATLIPENGIQADFMFYVYHIKTNIKIGIISGEKGTYRPIETAFSLSVRELSELSKFVQKIETAISVLL